MKTKSQALIGPNGAGKTTFFDLITGFTKQDSGITTFDGKNISNLESYKISRLGMVRTFQLTKVFDRMTVNENILFSASSLKNDRFINSLFKSSIKSKIEQELNERKNEVLNMVNLYHMKDSYARELSGGQKKLLELARVIIQKPKILLLDEPLAGVNPKLSEDI
jgi:neutral amino acid transport system ATP-binding protein